MDEIKVGLEMLVAWFVSLLGTVGGLIRWMIGKLDGVRTEIHQEVSMMEARMLANSTKIATLEAQQSAGLIRMQQGDERMERIEAKQDRMLELLMDIRAKKGG